jgi:chromosome segregation ATPase
MKIFIISMCVIFVGLSGPCMTMLSADMAYPPRKQQEEKKKVEKKVEKKKENKKEKKEEKKKKEIQKVWTNDDLKKIKNANITVIETGSTSKAKASTAKPATATKKRRTRKPKTKPIVRKPDKRTTKEYWQGRKNNILQKIADSETKIKQMEARAAELQQKYLMNDQLFSQQKQTEAEYGKLVKSIKNYKAGLIKLKQSLEDLRTEARKAGIPPGWVR